MSKRSPRVTIELIEPKEAFKIDFDNFVLIKADKALQNKICKTLNIVSRGARQKFGCKNLPSRPLEVTFSKLYKFNRGVK